MKKQLVLVCVAIPLICVGLGGCFEDDVNGEPSTNIQLISYNVRTWINPYKFGEEPVYVDGFNHSEHAVHYEITGVIKNNAGKKMNIQITANLYDENGIFLDNISTGIRDVADTYTEEFIMYGFNNSMGVSNFEHVVSVSFTLKEIPY